MKYSIFTKPWPKLTPDELGAKISGWGFDGIEFPLRDGFQVEPAAAEKDLPILAKKLSEYGVSITSVASSTDESVFAACQAAGVPIIRIMAGFDLEKGYLNCEKDFRARLDGLQPLCEKYGVKIGVQNHYGPMVFNSMELRHLLEGFDTNYIGAVWDAAHSGLSGEIAAQALDIIWDKLILVNIKNAYWRATNGPEALRTKWDPYFTLGRHGMASYEDIINYLVKRGYNGDICLPAEFSDEPLVEALTPVEFEYIKELFAKAKA